MSKTFARAALLLALLILPGCNVVLTLFSVPAQAQPGSVFQVVIAGNISGTTGTADCVLQLPNGWTVQGVTSSPTWTVGRDSAPLLASYVAEPGHTLAGFSGTGTGGIGGPQYLSQITLTVSVQVPASAHGLFTLKVSLAGAAGTGGVYQIQEPAGVAQFASIIAAPYALPIAVGVPPVTTDFAPHSSGLPSTAPPASWVGVAFGDVDGDGSDDLAATSFGSSPRCWLSRPGTNWVERSTGLATATQDARIAFGHLDGDSFLDLVDGNGNVYFGDGGNTWTPGAPLPLSGAASNYRGVATGDVDGDGLDDIALGGRQSGVLQVLLNNGNRTFRDSSAGLPTSTAGEFAYNLILEDLTGDGNLDMVWAHTVGPNLWVGDGQGGWSQGLGLPSSLLSATTADLDGDGLPDLVVSIGSGGIGVYKLAFGSSWAPLPMPGLPTGGYRSVATLDFDRDGLIDVVAARSFVLDGIDVGRNIGGAFAPRGSTGLPTYFAGDVTELAVGDLDGNTFPDLAMAVANDLGGGGALQAFRNVCTGVAPFGTGCAAGSFPEPALVAVGAPLRGNTSFAMQVQGQVPGAFSLFWFGASRTSAPPFALPLDLAQYGAPGCVLWAAPDVPYGSVLDGSGEFTFALPVPNLPEFELVTVYSQACVFAPGANPFGMVFSRGMAIRIR